MSANPPVPEDDIVVKLRKCSHVFHQHCILAWLDFQINRSRTSTDGTCPTCRYLLIQKPRTAASSISHRLARLNRVIVDNLSAMTGMSERIAARPRDGGLTAEETQSLGDRKALVDRTPELVEALRRFCAEGEESSSTQDANLQRGYSGS
jgi:hypothetical protein